MALAWRRKTDGKWLVEDARLTHTKLNTTYSFVDDINEASILLIVPINIRKGVEPVEVTETRTLTIIGE